MFALIMKVNNESIRVGDLEIESMGSSSLAIVGDTDQITSTSVFDTPADSLVFNPRVPLYPVRQNE